MKTGLITMMAFGMAAAASLMADTQPALLQALEDNIAASQFDGVRPLGDRNRPPLGTDGKEMRNPDGTLLTVGMTPVIERPTFSETVSYHLYFCVLAAEAAFRANDSERAERFLTDAVNSWEWARRNMQRINLKDVLRFDSGENHHQRISVPEKMRDNLLAWRWVPNIGGSAAGVVLGDGIILQTEDPKKAQHPWNKTFHDGLQPASDGDIMIAHCLLTLAELSSGNTERAQRWREDALAIIRDTRKKLVLDIQPGVLLRGDRPVPANFFSASWPESGRSGTISVVKHPDSDVAVHFSGRQCCVGLGFSQPLDLSALDAIELRLSGSGTVDVHLQDRHPADASRAHCGDSNPGRVVYHEIRLSKTPRAFNLPTAKFRRFPYHGNQSGNFDFGAVASLALQLSSRGGDVNVHSVAIKLTPQAVTTDWAGKQLVHSAQGEPYLNVSYWMPWIFEQFASAETDHTAFWRDLADRSYRYAQKAASIRLYAFPENDEPSPVIQGNGALVPNFFAIHPLTGEPSNLPYEAKFGMTGHVMGHDAFRTYYFLVRSLHEQQRDGKTLNADGLRLLKSMADFLVPFIIEQAGRPPAVFRIDGQPVGTDTAPVGMRAVYWSLYEFLLTGIDGETTDHPYRTCANLLAASLKEDLIVDRDQQRAWWNTQDQLWVDSPQEEYFQQYWAYFGLKLVHDLNPQALDSFQESFPMP